MLRNVGAKPESNFCIGAFSPPPLFLIKTVVLLCKLFYVFLHCINALQKRLYTKITIEIQLNAVKCSSMQYWTVT